MRILGAGSWHSSDFRLPDDVHYPHHDLGGRVEALGGSASGIVVTQDEIHAADVHAALRRISAIQRAIRPRQFPSDPAQYRIRPGEGGW